MKDEDLTLASDIEYKEFWDHSAERNVLNVCGTLVEVEVKWEMVWLPSLLLLLPSLLSTPPPSPIRSSASSRSPVSSPPLCTNPTLFSPLPLISHSLQAASLLAHTHTHPHASVSPLCIRSRLRFGPLEMDQRGRSNDGMQAHWERRVSVRREW